VASRADGSAASAQRNEAARLDPIFRDKLHLLDGMSSFEEALRDPELSPRVMEFMSAGVLAPRTDLDITDDRVPGPHGPVPVRVYRPAIRRRDRGSALLWVHGGGFTQGSVADAAHDATCCDLAVRADALVLSVEYRLAVDGTHYPIPLDDVVAALRWLRDGAAALQVDSARIAAGGDSAGGNLAAGAALRVRDEDGWVPSVLALAYPVLHAVLPPLSRDLIASVAGLPDLLRFLPDDVSAMNRNYLGGPESRADGYAMPGIADLEGLCPVLVINSECDDLRASGEAFVAALATSGVEVQQMTARGMLHAFLMLPDSVPAAARARDRIAQVVSSGHL
jgi:acetyl esterase